MKLSLSSARGLLAAWLLAALSEHVTAHSWPVETRRLARNGTMVGNKGYDRGHIEGGLDTEKLWQIPPSGRGVIQADDKIARPGQRALTAGSYSAKFPKLKVAPGDFAAILYSENGHVTGADNITPNKPINRGTVYLYGTTNNDLSNTNLADVHLKWTADGKGGDGKGKLLATRNYDDGQCHEPVSDRGDTEGILTYRQKFITNVPLLLCQSGLQIPADATAGQTLTVIWVWDWPHMSGPGVAVPPASLHTAAPAANQGASNKPFVTTAEMYTGVVDFEIVDPCDGSLGDAKGPTCKTQTAQAAVAVQFDAQQAAETRGIRAQMMNPFLVKIPQAGFNVAAATADPAHIPLNKLIGGPARTNFPLPASVLEAQTQYFAAPATTASAPATTPSATKTPPASSNPAPTSTADETVVVTVTVPERTVTVTVTERSANSSGAAATAATTPAPQPTATPSLSGSKRVRARRMYW